MASVNDIVGWIKSDLSRPNDSALDATIISKMGEAQAALEERPFLPWFLRQSSEIQNTNNEIILSNLTRFIRLQEETEIFVLDPSAALTGEPNRSLIRVDSLQVLHSYDLGSASSASTIPTHYYIYNVNTLLFRPRVFSGATFTFTIGYYRGDGTVPAAGLTTLWSQYASQLLKAETGKLVAIRLRDQLNAQRFAQDAKIEFSSLMRRHQAQLDVQQEYVMGGDG